MKTKSGEYRWDSATIRRWAETFSVANFKDRINEFIARHYPKK